MWTILAALMNGVGGVLLLIRACDWWMSIAEAGLISPTVFIIGGVFFIILTVVQVYYVTDTLVERQV
jgi:hypothetical protein